MTALPTITPNLIHLLSPQLFPFPISVQGLEGGALLLQSTLSTTLRHMNQRFAPAEQDVRGVCHLIP